MSTFLANKNLATTSPLGKQVSYCDHYSPHLLFPVARRDKRSELGITEELLPFIGFDLWNAYELSWLNPRGKPVVATGQFRFPANSPNLVESKSLKLYLNSFNQSRFSSEQEVADILIRDLSQAAGLPVEVSVHPLQTRPQRQLGYPSGELLDDLDINIQHYNLEPGFLIAADTGGGVTETLYSHLLKSNCLVTGQPDWATIVIRYTGPAIQREGLLRYLVSFRQHQEFHEQCVERIFCDLMVRCRPSSLGVWARYTRRGGLDINPFRFTSDQCEPEDIGEIRQ